MYNQGICILSEKKATFLYTFTEIMFLLRSEQKHIQVHVEIYFINTNICNNSVMKQKH